MVTISEFKKLALSFPETTEQPHFEKTSFRVRKKIFATLDEKENRATLKLNEIDQDVFTKVAPEAVSPVPNKWGKQGWTFVHLGKVRSEIFSDALTTAFCEVAPKRLSELLKQ
jgi:predicted DNA-binding protein (MmcQ/YjbR family)